MISIFVVLVVLLCQSNFSRVYMFFCRGTCEKEHNVGDEWVFIVLERRAVFWSTCKKHFRV